MGKIYCEPQMFLGYIDNNWDQSLRVVLYLVGLLWCFVGISIIADIFMGSIEVITSKEKVVQMPDGSRVTVKIWNATVANLTLMALGSSAPEILLSVIEILQGSFFSGDLGPSTIVGSAAFNLMFISAACVVAIPKGEGRTILQTGVFYITSGFSLFAYIWLLIILIGWTPNRVTVVEAVLTLVFFPILVILCYLVDAGLLGKKQGAAKIGPEDNKGGVGEGVAGQDGQVITEVTQEQPNLCFEKVLNKTEIQTMLKANRIRLSRACAADRAEEIKNELLKVALPAEKVPVSRARLRMNACRALSGQKRMAHPSEAHKILNPKDPNRPGSLGSSNQVHAINPVQLEASHSNDGKKLADDETKHDVEQGVPKMETPISVVSRGSLSPREVELNSCVGFAVGEYQIPCTSPNLTLKVPIQRRVSNIPCNVKYKMVSGTAVAGKDYDELDEGVIHFDVNETAKTIAVPVYPGICDKQKKFSMELKLENPPQNDSHDWLLLKCDFIIVPKIQVTDRSGSLGFKAEHTAVSCFESDEYVAATVSRVGGYTGSVSCMYQTGDITAKATKDYTPIDGEITFEQYEMVKQLWIHVLDDQEVEKDENLKLVLNSGSGSPRAADPSLAPNLRMECIITIKNDDVITSHINMITKMLNMDLDMYRIGSTSYKEQFIDAISVGCEPGEKPTIRDWIMHIIALPWKLFFALVPPTIYCDGKLCFCIALGGIALVTILVGDLANLLGCAIGLKTSVTAITFVALGTSLPDTFASMTAAKMDKYADNSIGNITGSNSVNVFLGIGLPWTIAAIYWAVAGRTSAWEEKYGGPSTTASVYNYYAAYPDGGFIVPSGDLGISVMVFAICAILCLGTLMARRKFLGFELGGPVVFAKITAVFFVMLWFIYVLVSAIKAYGYF